MKTKKENPNGLYMRYFVKKTDGTPIDPEAEYFVLRLDDKGSDPVHIQACRKAVLVYAEAIRDHLPQLSADLIEMYGNTRIEPSRSTKTAEDGWLSLDDVTFAGSVEDVLITDGINIDLGWYDSNSWHSYLDIQPTHYMRLPQPPKKG